MITKPVPEVNSPEAIITANSSEHLVVPPLHSKRWILKENFLQSRCVSHPAKVNSCQVVFTCINHIINICLVNIHHIYLQAGTPAHQCSSHRGSGQTCPGLSPEPARCTPGLHSCSVGIAWPGLNLLADQLHACKYLINTCKKLIFTHRISVTVRNRGVAPSLWRILMLVSKVGRNL